MNRIPLAKTLKFVVDNRGRTAPTAVRGIPLIATNCVNNKDLYPVYENVRYVDRNTFENWFRSHPEPGDIILTLKGSQNGAVCLVPDPVDFVIAQDMVAIRADENVIYPLFLFAALRSEDVQQQIRNLDVSGVIPHFKKTDFDKLQIPYPEKRLRKFIGDFYFQLSKKVFVLQRENETLEMLAETAFRAWFMEQPKDTWERKPLDQIANYLNGLPLQKYPANGTDSLHVIKIKELNQGITNATDRCSRSIPDQYVVRDGDVLFSWSGSLQIVIWHDGEGALNQHLFKVTSEKYPKWFYYFATKHHLEEFRAIAESKSTTMGHIQRHHLSEAMIPIAAEPLFEQYDRVISPLIEKIILNNAQIKTLTNQRDMLLPKLLSGEVSIRV